MKEQNILNMIHLFHQISDESIKFVIYDNYLYNDLSFYNKEDHEVLNLRVTLDIKVGTYTFRAFKSLLEKRINSND